MYGLALLNSDYDGNCITVRRASDNSTTNIGFSGQDLDIAALETFCSGTDGFVTTWFDQSGNIVNAVQTTASQQPQIVSSGSVISENGKPAIQFDGVDDLLDLGQTIDLYTFDSIWSIFIDSKISNYSLETFQRILFNDSALSSEDIPLGIQYRDNDDIYFFNAGSNYQTSIASATQRSLISFLKRSSDVTIKINGVSETATKGTFDFTTGLENTVIGCSPNGSTRPSKLKTSALVIYTNDESSNQTEIETALNNYYNIY